MPDTWDATGQAPTAFASKRYSRMVLRATRRSINRDNAGVAELVDAEGKWETWMAPSMEVDKNKSRPHVQVRILPPVLKQNVNNHA